MKVSIITVSFNSSKTIEGTIQSVLAQRYENIEYIIIDGGSRDGTIDVIERYRSSISVLISEPDEGIYDAMNKGLAHATGDVIGILNSDDVYESESVISNVVKHLLGSPSCSGAFGDVVFVDPNDLRKVARYYTASHFRPWKLRFGWMPPHPATFLRREVYEKVGVYAPSYKISADYEFFVRMLLVHKLTLTRFDAVLVRMRLGGASTGGIKSSWVLNKEIVRACRVNGIYTNIVLVLSKLPFKLLELIRRPQPNHG